MASRATGHSWRDKQLSYHSLAKPRARSGMWSKRLSMHSTVVGGVLGAAPVLGGYFGAGNSIDPGADIVFLMSFQWRARSSPSHTDIRAGYTRRPWACWVPAGLSWP